MPSVNTHSYILLHCTNPVIQFPGEHLISPPPAPQDEGRGIPDLPMRMRLDSKSHLNLPASIDYSGFHS